MTRVRLLALPALHVTLAVTTRRHQPPAAATHSPSSDGSERSSEATADVCSD